MIHAKELRIGNKVFYKPWDNKIAQNQIVTISWVSDNDAGYYEQHEASYPHAESEYSPIPLTPEILEKCGFRFDDQGRFFYNGLRVPTSFVRWEPAEGWIQLDAPIGTTMIKSLHHLQNWFHAISGQELTIKETPQQ